MNSNRTAISHLRDEAAELYSSNHSYTQTAKILCERHSDLPGPNWVRNLVALELSDEAGDQGLIDDNHKLRRQKQRATDKLRQANKIQRQQDQRDNATQELLSNIQENLQNVGKGLKKLQKYSGKFKTKGSVMVVHLSDLHLQELIDLPDNKFDFVIAGQRLKLMAEKIKTYGAAFGITRIVLAMGGDFINSDRRHDEVLNNATNRSRAVVLAVHLLRQFILDLRQNFYIDVVGVCGNEGRAKEELAWSAVGATDSYDALTYWMLRQVLESEEDRGLRFNSLQSNECVFTIHNETFLLVHGHQVKMTDQKSVQAIMGKFQARGINVSHVIAGHIHAAMVSDYASRNSSLCGSNSYSSAALNFISKASQNIHIVHKEGGLDGIKLDLQQVPEGYKGYDMMSALQQHGARTHDGGFKEDTQVEPLVIV